MKTVTKRLLAMIAVILAIGALGLLARQFGSLENVVENEIQLRNFVQQHPWQGWVLGLLAYTVLSLVPGTAGKSVVCGWLFGFWPAVLMVDVGLTIAAMVGFLAARFFIRDAVRARWKVQFRKFNARLEKDRTFFMLMTRLAHVPYSLVNYCAGATTVPLSTFCWTTSLGILPGTMIFVFVGTRIPTLQTLAEKGAWELFDPLLFGILAATVVFPVLIRLSIGQYRRHFQEDKCGELASFEVDAFETWKVDGRTNGAH